MWDMDAKVRKDLRICNVGRYSLHEEPNDNGMRLTDFSTSRNMADRSMRFPYKDIHKETWIYPMTKQKFKLTICQRPRHF